jgi:hypothetical protein
MNPCEHLAEQVRRVLDGDAWHGPSWREVLEGVSREEALAHPVPGAHSIAEVVRHTVAWHEIVRQRLLGQNPQVSEEDDWPDVAITTEADWALLQGRLRESGHALREVIAAFPPERLHEPRPGLSDTWYGLMIGELQHMLYHAGQVPILHRAATAML